MTSFDTIYNRAIAFFKDYTWLKYSDDDREFLLRNYLRRAQADFEPISKEPLTYSDAELAYDADLSDTVIDVLAAGVGYYWLQSKVNNSENLRNYMSTKDYTFFSPANLLREMNNLLEFSKKEYQRRITMYGYFKADIAKLQN